jgi:pimeloyl-ACP methyl ester carboxylesterase
VIERFVQVDGLRTRYLEEGRGRPVLLLHGASLGSSCDVWRDNMAPLARAGLRLIAPDLPGFGETDNPDDPSVGFRARFMPRFMDAVGLESASVVGHSQSGRIAVTLGTKNANRVPRIIVVGTASMLPPLSTAGGSDAGDGDEGGATEPTLEETREQVATQLFDKAAATEERVALRHRMSTGKNFAAFIARRAAKAGEKKEKGAAPWERLREVAVPMRLIYGKQDRAASERAALLRSHMPSIDLQVVDRCRHLLMWDRPDAFEQLARDFLGAQSP